MIGDSAPFVRAKSARKPRRWPAVLVAALIVLVIVFLAACWSIGSSVRSISDTALRDFPGDRVSALMALVESERHGFRERNRAIWALGQLGDPRALPVLEKHCSGAQPARESLDGALSQHELKKAVALCRGATNISALVWRHGALAPQAVIPRPLAPVPFTAVHVDDKFWAPKIEINRTVSIPSAFKQCEINGRIDNFALAAGTTRGEHKGDFPFDDTDVYKVIEGASYALAVKYDARLDAYLDSVIALIAGAQEDDGYLYTCLTNTCKRLERWYGKGRWDRLNSHELYNCGHLYEAAVAHYQATGKRGLLNVAIKNADLVDRSFGPAEGQKKAPSGHPIIEMSLVRLYRATGEERYLKLARFFIDETGKGTDGHELGPYSQDHKPIVDQDEAVGHAVRLGYLYAGVTDVASLMNDTALMSASKRVWDNVVSKKLYVTGGIGSRGMGEGFGPNYELPNMTGYCETCASIANVYWNYRLFLNEGDSRYCDVLERVLYNGVISGVSLGGDKFFYDNPLESNRAHERAPWFGCACCPGNVTRFMASVPGYIYAAAPNAIAVNLFIGSKAEIPMGEDTVGLSQTTDYPWDGAVTIAVDDPGVRRFDLLVRVPGWARGEAVPSDLYRFADSAEEPVVFRVNGEKIAPKITNGYALIRKQWKKGDEVEMSMPMPVRALKANPQVESDRGAIAFQRGPLVYCFEDKDNGDGWMFDLFVPRDAKPKHQFVDSLLGGVVTLSMSGYKVAVSGADTTVEATALTAIPYYAWANRGAANMRVWMGDSRENVLTKTGWGREMEGTASSSLKYVWGLNTGFDPRSSADIDKSYFYFWERQHPEEWVQYDFKNPVTLSESRVYWLNLDHYDGNYRAPESWRLMVQDAKKRWVSVATTDPFGVELDTYNVVTFKPVATSAIRLMVKLPKDGSAGILSWKVQ